MSDTSPKPFTSNSPSTDEPSSTNTPPQDLPLYPHTSTPRQDLQLKEDEGSESTKEASLEATKEKSKDIQEDNQASQHRPRGNPSLVRLRFNQDDSSAKRPRLSDSDDEGEPVKEPERGSTGSQTSGLECAITRSALRINGDDRLLDRVNHSPPHETQEPPLTPPLTPPRTLQFQNSISEMREGGEPAELVTPENKPVTPNNGQLAIGYYAILVSPQQPDVNNNAMLNNNGRPVLGRPWSV